MNAGQASEPATIQADDAPAEENGLPQNSDASTLTQSLLSSLRESVRENGRGYHRYKATAGNDYPLPEDEGEQERLELHHETFVRTLCGKLHLAPIGQDVREVLDLGTGTGQWAMDFADQHPEAQVLGTDLSPIQPSFVPPNCKFEMDDFNSEWTFVKERFEFIHLRSVIGSSQDYPAIVRKAYEALRPGGWLEMSDFALPFRSDDGTMKGTQLEAWNENQVESCRKLGVDAGACTKYKAWMTTQGFEGVEEKQFKWPVGTWAKDQRYKEFGSMTLVNFLMGLESFTLRLWTSALGMELAKVQEKLVQVREEVMGRKIHAYWPV
jgi:SAM-dependent methyltransferase